MQEAPYDSTFSHLSEVRNAIGQEIGLSKWMTISQQQVDDFARLTGDEQWIHTDPVKAKQHSPYGGTVAHGFYLLSLASKFAYELYRIEDAKMVVNYGLDRVRFPHATPVGSRLRVRAELMAYEEKPDGAQLKMKMTFELEGIEKPACVAELLAQCYV